MRNKAHILYLNFTEYSKFRLISQKFSSDKSDQVWGVEFRKRDLEFLGNRSGMYPHLVLYNLFSHPELYIKGLNCYEYVFGVFVRIICESVSCLVNSMIVLKCLFFRHMSNVE